MQWIHYSKYFCLLILFAMTSSCANSPDSSLAVKQPIEIKWTNESIAACIAFIATAAIFFRLVTKKTQPKLVYPHDDSLAEAIRYILDELLVGQIQKGERISKFIMNPEDESELIVEYSKIEARGVAGIIYSAMKPIIIPTLTLMALFNKNFKDELIKGFTDARTFIADPTLPFKQIANACLTGDCSVKNV